MSKPLSKLIATYLDRPHLLTALAWALWLGDVLYSWAASGQPLNAHTFVLALVTGLATKRPGDATPKQVAAKMETVRVDAARGARLSSRPPSPWSEAAAGIDELDLPAPSTPLPGRRQS